MSKEAAAFTQIHARIQEKKTVSCGANASDT